jgi:hypothetical protein
MIIFYSLLPFSSGGKNLIKASMTRVIKKRITKVPPMPTTVRVNPNSKFVTFRLPPTRSSLRAHSNAWKIRVKIFFADSSSGELRIPFPPQATSPRSLLVFAGVHGLIKTIGNKARFFLLEKISEGGA